MSDLPREGMAVDRTRRPPRGWVVNLALMVGGVVFALLLGEVLLRLFFTPRVPTIPHRIHHHTRPEGGAHRWKSAQGEFDQIVRFNSLALRGSAPDLDRESLWVVMGDSMIEALQVSEEETLCAILEESLGGSATVLNAGVGGYSPVLMHLRLIDLLERIAPRTPDRLFVCLFPNDLEEEYLYRTIAYTDLKGEIIAVTPGVLRGRLGGVRVGLFKHSRIWRLVQKGLVTTPEERERGRKIDPDRVLDPFRPVWTEAERMVWGELFRGIGDIDFLCRERGILLTLVIVPPGHQVSPDAWKTGKQTMKFPPDSRVESTSFQDEIRNRARRVDLEVIDLLPEFRSHPRPEELYFDYDGHWTAEGNRFAAQAILKALSEETIDEPSSQ